MIGSRRKNHRLLPALLILLLAALLRLHALGRDSRFHPDEALFASFARRAAVQGDWLLPGALDKPPLAIYIQAAALALVGVTTLPDGTLTLAVLTGEFAARLPGALASLLLVAVVYALARRLYRDRLTAALAAGLLALSPLAVAYSAAAFTDGPMLLGVGLALLLAASGRAGGAGLALGLAFACKPQALYALPLAGALLWTAGGQRGSRALVHAGLPLALVIGLLLLWDAARGQPAGWLTLAVANNDPGRLIRADEVLPRLRLWLAQAGALAGPGALTTGLFALALAAFAVRLARPPRGDTLMDALLLAYGLVYGFIHWLAAFNTYDRYLLPLLPVAALLLARGLVWGWRGLPDGLRIRALAAAAISGAALALLPAAWDAAEGRAPVGGDRDSHPGITALADDLNARSLGAIIYDHWLGWELDYYLGAWTDKRRVYYPAPGALAADARRQPDPAPRYFVAPADRHTGRWLAALGAAGFQCAPPVVRGGLVLYELIPPGADVSAAGSSSPGLRSPCAG